MGEGKEVGVKRKGIFESIIGIIRGSKWDDGYIINQILSDVLALGENTAWQYVNKLSPSKLGKMGYLGLRKLAIIKRDDPEFWNKITNKLTLVKVIKKLHDFLIENIDKIRDVGVKYDNIDGHYIAVLFKDKDVAMKFMFK